MTTDLSEDNLHRLVNFLIENENCKTPEEAKRKLERFKLSLVCGEEIANTKALQAALLTAINTGKRAFLGGVEVVMRKRIKSLLYWPDTKTLNDCIKKLGGTLVNEASKDSSFSLSFGKTNGSKNSLQVVCNGWVGGISELKMTTSLPLLPDFALGGIVGGSLGVAGAFFRVTGLDKFFGSDPIGISLWKPDVNWLLSEATGSPLKNLPKNLWILGLGHLGQAYLWNFGLLLDPSIAGQIKILLQDFDVIKKANFSTGLLSEDLSVEKKKTRVCAEWLEQRQIKTIITERRFNENTYRDNKEPFVAISGFDNAEPRRLIENVGFDFIVDASLGNSIDDFDRFMMYTFPDNTVKAVNIWKESSIEKKKNNKKLIETYLKETNNPECGILASTLAGKAIATSFVGAIAGAFVIAEILKGLHGKKRCGFLHVHLRDLLGTRCVWLDSCQEKFSQNGFVSINT